MKSTNLVFVLKNIDWIYIKSTDPVLFFLKNIDWIYMESTDLFFVLKNIDQIYMKIIDLVFFCFEKHRLDLYEKHGSSFCLEKEHNETFMIDFLADLRFQEEI